MADDELDDVFRGAGELAGAYARTDWAATALGPVAGWSSALRRSLDVVLGTRFPATLLWGAESVLLYNADYVEIIADKHPAALGAPARAVFPEIWSDIDPLLRSVMSGEGATWAEDQPLPLQRRGRLEEAVFTFSYSPAHGEDGAVEGVIDLVTEVTRRVVDRRRLELLSHLDRSLVDVASGPEVQERGLAVLRTATDDLVVADLHPVVRTAERPHASPAVGGGDSAGLGAVGVRVPAAGADGRDQLLVVEPAPLVVVDEGYLSFLRLAAASLAQALDRVRARETQALAAAAERAMSETLQRSLLTRPPHPPGLDVAVRYRPAGTSAQIGGDWYDAFELSDGSLTLSIGDVTGHDRHAAAAMAQVRNLLRGIAYTLEEPPALVLTALDAAMQGLAVDVFATAVLAQVRQAPPGPSGPGARLLRWSNAGHLPPVLIDPDGTARSLVGSGEGPPDLLLGLDARTARTDHTALLEPGSVVVMFTDGLVERRSEALQDSLEELTAVLAGCPRASADEVCEHLLERYRDDTEDDLALVVLRLADAPAGALAAAPAGAPAGASADLPAGTPAGGGAP